MSNRDEISSENEVMVERFQESLWFHKGASEKTLDSYRADLEKLALFLSEHAPEERLTTLVAPKLQSFFDAELKKGISPRSLARYLSCY